MTKKHQGGAKLVPPPMPAEESSLFRTAVGDARPLPDNGRVFFPSHHSRHYLRQTLSTAKTTMVDGLSDHITSELAKIGADEDFSFLRPGLTPQTLKKLRHGHWKLQAEADFHGLNTTEARSYLVDFLDESRNLDLRCVRVIHGKGFGSINREPVLKQKVANWLMQRSDVLAFCPAQQADGGSGATIVLLKAS